MALGRPTPARRVKAPTLCWHTSSQGQAHGAQAPLPTLGPPAESLRPLRDHSPARLARALPTLLPALGPVPPSQGSRPLWAEAACWAWAERLPAACLAGALSLLLGCGGVPGSSSVCEQAGQRPATPSPWKHGAPQGGDARRCPGGRGHVSPASSRLRGPWQRRGAPCGGQAWGGGRRMRRPAPGWPGPPAPAAGRTRRTAGARRSAGSTPS